jgi:putative ABC transport system ATP-binding protein
MRSKVLNNYIKLSDAGKCYPLAQKSISLFENINLTINKGESTAIVGSSGAGKSTLLLLSAGLETLDSGSLDYVCDGQPQTINALRKNTGFIFQQFHLLPELTALQNVALPLKLKGEKHADNLATDWLEKVGLAERAQHKPNQLSGGEQQRVAIARCMATQPEYIFADEPTGNLDESTADSICDLLFSLLKTQQIGLVLVTHNPELAQRCDTVLRLKNGHLNALETQGTHYA